MNVEALPHWGAVAPKKKLFGDLNNIVNNKAYFFIKQEKNNGHLKLRHTDVSVLIQA
jgi:hypothetical protein